MARHRGYLDIGEAKKKPAEVNNELSVEDVKPVTHSKINVSARFRNPLQDPCTIFLIANGDLINPAVRLFIPRKILNQWDNVLEMVTEKVTLRSGAVYRLYTLDGKLVQSGSDLENGQFYVAVGRDKFKKLPYGELLYSKSTIRSSKASSLPPAVGSRKSKGSGNDRQSKSTLGSSDTGDMVSSPQPPKRKGKREYTQEKIGFSNKPTKTKQKVTTSIYVLQDNDEGIYKAGEKRSEMWGAVEIQEDEDTQVEVPVDQRAAETVDEEEDEEQEEEGDEGEMNGEADQGEEMGDAANGNEIEENEEKLNENYEEEQVEEDEPFRLGETNQENGEEMEQFNDLNSEEETKAPEDFDNQSQIDSHLGKKTNPRVTITSPQESEKNDQTNEYAAVA
ncbi:doublecortin domain-containing protein 2 isoform X1 [Emydura macquarii macquarii]|uniref:doublecortin domain-containing protein 2 isoform X1 n=1 Tax=Emydura macquarii macquarii TaxID=1129001 RepID=UPI00352AF9CB